MNSISLQSNKTEHCLTVYFLDKNGGTVRRAQFWNFINNGDTLARVSAEWINHGLLPSREENGLHFF